MKFNYTNYKGENADRDLDILSLDFLTNPGFGYEPGWFLTGRDRDKKGDVRSFRIDGRMLPTEVDLAARVQGMSGLKYEITEGHQIRSTVEKLQDAVLESVDDARRRHVGEE